MFFGISNPHAPQGRGTTSRLAQPTLTGGILSDSFRESPQKISGADRPDAGNKNKAPWANGSVFGLKQGLFRSWFFSLIVSLLVLGSSSIARPSSWDPGTEIRKYLKNHYPWTEIEILDISEVSSPVPPEKIHLIQGPLGRALFSLVFKSGEKTLVQAHIRALDWVVTSRRPLKKLQPIRKEDVYLALTDVRRMPKDALTRLESAWGKIMTRSLGANMPIIQSHMGDIPLIKKGQRITLVAAVPGLKITTPGEARQDGFSGQSLKVLNLSSKRDVRGIPLDENHVRVEF